MNRDSNPDLMAVIFNLYNDQLIACSWLNQWLNWWSTAPASQRSEFWIPFQVFLATAWVFFYASLQWLPIPDHSTQARCLWLGVDFGEEGKPEYPEKNPQVRLRLTENSAPRMTAEMGGANVEYNANLTSPGIQHRDTRIVAHPDINPAQQDLTLMIKWETVFSLGQAVRRV